MTVCRRLFCSFIANTRIILDIWEKVKKSTITCEMRFYLSVIKVSRCQTEEALGKLDLLARVQNI